MDFTLTELQEMIRTSARDFLKTNCPKSLVREMAKSESGFAPDLWNQMREMGWMGLIIPEEFGGAGGRFIDLVVLLEEMGRFCLPGPFFSSVVLGGLPVCEAGSEGQKRDILHGLAEGKLFLTLALTEATSDYSADGISTKATLIGDKYIIQGTKLFVPDAHLSNYLICPAKTKETDINDDRITLFLIDSKSPGINCNMLQTIAGDKQCEVTFDKVEVPVNNILGELNKGWPILEKILEKAVIAQCAEMVGGAKQLLETTVEYAKQRKAFGRHIGSFQAIQHYFANMLIDADGCALLVYNAAWRLSEGLPATKEVSMAKAIANQNFKHITGVCLQINGAIGFTEDSDVPLYFKRAKGWEVKMGDTQFHLDKLAKTLGI